MSTECCDYEEAIAAALLHGRLDGSMRDHLAACPYCANVQLAWQYFAQFTRGIDEGMPSGAPGLIWWRAQLEEKRERAQRAVAAIELMQKLTICLTFIAILVFAWLWGADITPIYPSTLLIAAGMVVGTGAVLYGWARGRI